MLSKTSVTCLENQTKLRELEVSCPFAVYLPRKTKNDKRIPISLNWYRNAFHHENAFVKKYFLELVKDQLEGKQLQIPVKVSYRVYKPTRRRLDKMNVVAITSKFLLDAMSTLGVIPDDNDEYIKNELILPTIHDKDSPRVVVKFKSIEE